MSVSPTSAVRRLGIDWLRLPWLPALGALVLLVVCLRVSTPDFSISDHTLVFASVSGMAALGEAFVIANGGIDLSVLSATTLALVMSERAMACQFPVGVAIAAGLLTGTAAGLFNAILVARSRLPAAIATFGALYLYWGLAIVIETWPDWIWVDDYYDLYRFFWDASIRNVIPGLTIPSAFVVFLAAGLAAAIWLRIRRGTRGRGTATAQLGPVSSRTRLAQAYVTCGFCCGVGGVMWAGSFNSSSLAHPSGLPVHELTAVLVGGTVFGAGRVTVLGTVLGVFFVRTLSSLLYGMTLSPEWVLLVEACVFVLAATVEVARRRNGHAGRVQTLDRGGARS